MTSTSKTNHTQTKRSHLLTLQQRSSICNKLACEVLEPAEHIPLFTHSVGTLSAPSKHRTNVARRSVSGAARRLSALRVGGVDPQPAPSQAVPERRARLTEQGAA